MERQETAPIHYIQSRKKKVSGFPWNKINYDAERSPRPYMCEPSSLSISAAIIS